MEAEAREHLSVMRSTYLNAPSGYNPRFLHRISGVLADSAFRDPQNNGLRQVLKFPAEYAEFHDATLHPTRGFRDVYRRSLMDRRDDILRSINSRIGELIGA